MSEGVTRHRGGGYDENDDPVDWDDEPLVAKAVANGATAEYVDRGRNGQKVALTVFFRPAVDLTNDDELTVRGDRYLLQVEQWPSPFSSRTGTVALCSRGQG